MFYGKIIFIRDVIRYFLGYVETTDDGFCGVNGSVMEDRQICAVFFSGCKNRVDICLTFDLKIPSCCFETW